MTGNTSVCHELSASIYCHGFVDRLLRAAVLPFWKELKEEHPRASLWVILYSRGGQHLKLRLKVPSPAGELVKAKLENAAESFFTLLPAAIPQDREENGHLPPIDPEDLGTGLRPDRNLVWTTYRYQPELVGAEPLSADPAFEGIYVRCLTASTELILEWLDALGDVAPSDRQRMALALRLLAVAAGKLQKDPKLRIRYLAFQRDWLLRVGRDRDQAIELFDRKAGEALRQQPDFGRKLNAANELADHGSWPSAIDALARFCAEHYVDRDLSRLETSAEQIVYFAASRIIHNAVNPTGIGLSNEAYACHLMAVALSCDSPALAGELKP